MSYSFFDFVDERWQPDSASFVAEVPQNIRTSSELLDVLFSALKLPGYFGFNWNALNDCLRDFHWIEETEVVLRHLDVPQLDAAELGIYISVLNEAINDWKPGEAHRFKVVFPRHAKPIIDKLQDADN